MVTLSLDDLRTFANSSLAGNRQLLELFSQAAYDFVLGIASELLRGNRLRRWIDPCDIAQNVVLKACRKINNFQGSEIILNWKAFLRRLTYRNVIDQARSLRTELRIRKSLDLDSLEQPTSASITAMNFDSENSRENTLVILRAAETALSETWICILQLRLDGLTWNKIAVLYNMHPQTLRVRFQQAIRKLRLADPTL